jgi:type I restriction enzyme S subunit
MRDGWTETTLGDIAEVVGGGTPSTSKEEFWDGDVVWLTPTEVTAIDGKVISDSKRKITQAGLQSSGARILPKGTVILTSRASVGFVALAGTELTTNQGFQSLIPSELVDGVFLMFWIQMNRAEFESRSAGSTFKEISKSNVKSIAMNLPPLEEQKRIVDVMSSVDAYIDALQQQADTARTARNAVLHELLSAGGDDWTATTLGEVALVVNGSTPSTKNPEFWGGDIPWITTTELTALDGGYVSSSSRKITAAAVENGGARLVRSGVTLLGTTATIGTVALAAVDTCFNQQISGLIPKLEKVFDEFLFVWARGNRFQLDEMAAGTSFKRISTANLKNLNFLLPPLVEQKRIVEIVLSMDDVIQSTEQAVTNAKNLRSGLLSDLLSGEHEIPESYDRFVGAA